MDWLRENAPLLSALGTCGMFLIWAVYASLFYLEFRRRRWPQLFLHEAGGGATGSTCLLVNLGREPVHVLCSMAACDGVQARLHDTSGRDGLPSVQRAKQGPLEAGKSLTLGSFDDIRREIDAASNAPPEKRDYVVDVRVAAINGDASWPVGASRRFCIDVHGGRVMPQTPTTRQLHSKRQSAEVQRWVDGCYDSR